MARLKSGSLLVLDGAEWDFRRVSSVKRELIHATIYEYVRSSAWKQILEEWFDQPFWIGTAFTATIHCHKGLLDDLGISKKSAGTIRDVIRKVHVSGTDRESKALCLSYLGQDADLYLARDSRPGGPSASVPFSVALRFPDFPEPWLKVVNLSGFAEQLAFKWPDPAQAASLIDLDDDLEGRMPDPFYSLHSTARPQYFREHHLEIDWRFSREQIKKDLEDWVDLRHPEGRGNPHDEALLKKLAAYRLRQSGFTAKKALEFVERYSVANPAPNDSLEALPLYGSEKSFNEAARQAGKLLRSSDIPKFVGAFYGSLWLR